MRKDFFQWTNSLWAWIIAAEMLYVSTYVIYLVGRYAIPRGDVGASIFGIIYSFAFAFCTFICATRAIEIMRKPK